MTAPVQDTSSKVVYTAILGGVDTLLAPATVDEGWDYVCFSDEPIDCPPWRHAPIALQQPTLARESRYLKVNATTMLPAAEVSLWVDGNVQPMASAEALLEQYLDGGEIDRYHLNSADLALHGHPERGCLFDEAVAIIDQGKDATATVLAQILRYARAGVPVNTGLYATAAILRRHSTAVRKLEQTWWGEIAAGSHRDQLSLPYALRTHGISPARLEGDVWRTSLFRHRRHDGPNAPKKIKLPDGSRRMEVVPAPHLPESHPPSVAP